MHLMQRMGFARVFFLSHLVFSVLHMHWQGRQREPITHPESYIEVTPQVRVSYLARAIVWERPNMRAMTADRVRQGEPTSLQTDKRVSCTYVYKTHQEIGGNTPKFDCRDKNGKIYRIKYGKVKPHTTVAASRLLWVLGFGAATSTPVRVICTDCSPDPWNRPQPIEGETTFNEAVVQNLKAGKEITLQGKAEVGWSWSKDLPLVSEEAGGANRAQVDALKLVAVLIQHGDSKAPQQKLICRPRDYDPHNNSCRHPYMYIYDLGNTFGSGGMKVHPLNFEAWRHKSVFRDQVSCIGNLQQNVGNGPDGLTFPKISEKGRRFLADLLGEFISNRSRVVAMFEVAHMEMADPRHSADDWADVFISKVREITDHSPCPD